MTEKEQQPVTPEIPTEAADKPESDNPPKNENRRGANQAERERTIAQNRQRLREIVDVVRKHDILHGITPEKLCAIIEDLGPTFIKLGQILSMRSDILPRDYCEALKKLRSNVSPMPFEQVQRVVETSYGCPMEEVFASFDEKALGSASIAQAHAAILKSGERVVVKVQREGIHEVMSRDIILLKQACKVLKYTPAGSLVDFNQVLDEMWVVAQEEMNFQTEAANLERFHALKLPLLGDHQLHNAAVALTAATVMQQRGWHLTDEHIREGLASVRWPGRFDVRRKDPLFIIDGGHNPQCIQAIVKNIQDYPADRPLTILTGVLADKDYNCMYRNVEPYAKEFITVTPGNPRALNAHDLAQYLSQFGKPVTACDAVADGVRLAVEHAGKDGVVLCYGSLYMIGEIEAGLQQL